MALAECIDEHYIHFVASFLQLDACRNLSTVHVHPTVGVLNHYRTSTANLPENKEQVADHYVVNMFEHELLAAVTRVETKLWKLQSVNPTIAEP